MAGNGLTPHRSTVSGPTVQAGGSGRRYRGDVGKYDLDTGLQFKDSLSWAQVRAEAIIDAIVAVTDVGDALMFSRTSDGGAYSITVMSGGKSAKVWPSEPEAAETVLTTLTARAAGL
jgi:hypothetical protein